MNGLKKYLIAALAVLALFAPANARAVGGNYEIEGGSAAERTQIRSALRVSSFDWSVVSSRVRIRVIRGLGSSYSDPGEIGLDADLLDAGHFAWGVVQHEYAHQVDFSLFDDTTRARVLVALGGKIWFPGGLLQLRHDQYGCERFASTLAWSYWPSPENSMRPSSNGDESAAMSPHAFRALLQQTLGNRDPFSNHRP